MKFRFSFVLIAVLSFLFFSCGSDMSSELVKEIQPVADGIIIEADTFHINTETRLVESIISKPDSFLLGSFHDNIYGTTQGEILTQFNYPKNYTYMNPAVAVSELDSIVLSLNFYSDSYFGDTIMPMEIKVYELNKILNYNTNYHSNENPADYADLTKLLGNKQESWRSADWISEDYSKTIRIKLSSEFVQRFFDAGESIFATDNDFLNFFKGLYITTTFGSSTLLNIQQVLLDVHGHYTYVSSGEVATFNINLTSTEEYKRINIISHSQRNPALLTNSEYNYVCAPANYYTRLKIPIGRMRERLKVGDKHLIVNSSVLTINAADKDSLGTQLPYVGTMLLIKENEMNNFFSEKKTPSDSLALVASIGKSAISATKYKYFYKFDNLSTIVTNEIKNTDNDELNMLLIPVKLKYNSSTSAITEVVPSYTMEAAAIFGGKNSRVPMKMEVVYSGF